MSHQAFNNVGTTTANLDAVLLGTGAIASAHILLLNNSDATVRGRITVPDAITVPGQAAGDDYDFTLNAFSYEILDVAKAITTGS